jgi:hypothetical protein
VSFEQGSWRGDGFCANINCESGDGESGAAAKDGSLGSSMSSMLPLREAVGAPSATSGPWGAAAAGSLARADTAAWGAAKSADRDLAKATTRRWPVAGDSGGAVAGMRRSGGGNYQGGGTAAKKASGLCDRNRPAAPVEPAEDLQGWQSASRRGRRVSRPHDGGAS